MAFELEAGASPPFQPANFLGLKSGRRTVEKYFTDVELLNQKVKYYVYAPATGKLMTEGKIYYQSIGGGGARSDNWPSGPPIKITAEATGLEVAERLHDWLLLGSPPKDKQ
ncbi:MAG: hypothetical protein ACRD8U_10755 [Pyrinomonadaceae bacterium]